MLSTAQFEEVRKSESAGEVIIFAQKLNPETSDSTAILKEFEALLGNKPVGTFLLRESRQEGRITLSCKQSFITKEQTIQQQIRHYRFVFSGTEWQICSDSKEPIETTSVNKDSIGDKCQQLLSIIEKKRIMINSVLTPIKMHQILLPNSHQHTLYAGYSNYTAVSATTQRFNDPLKALTKVKTLLKNELSGLNLEAATHEQAQSEANRTAFMHWLEEKKPNLADTLSCPISTNLLRNPRVIDGHAYERSTIYEGDSLVFTHSPLTRNRIETTPYAISGYTHLLNKCLALFCTLRLNTTKVSTPSYKELSERKIVHFGSSKEGPDAFEEAAQIECCIKNSTG